MFGSYLDPLPEQGATDRIVPVLAAREAEGVAAAARDGRRLHVRDLNRVAAVRRRAPPQQAIAL